MEVKGKEEDEEKMMIRKEGTDVGIKGRERERERKGRRESNSFRKYKMKASEKFIIA